MHPVCLSMHAWMLLWMCISLDTELIFSVAAWFLNFWCTAGASILNFAIQHIFLASPTKGNCVENTSAKSTLNAIQFRAVATGPAGPAAAGPMFGRIHKFSTTLFDLSIKPRTKQSAWNNKQGKANMCVWFWVCNLPIYFSAHVFGRTLWRQYRVWCLR